MKKKESWGREIINTESKKNSNYFIFSETENKEKKSLTSVSEKILVAWIDKCVLDLLTGSLMNR